MTKIEGPRKQSRTVALAVADLEAILQELAWPCGLVSDVVVSCLGKPYRLHKLVLCRSPFFKAMFDGEWTDSDQREFVLNLEDERITEAAVETVLGALYGKRFALDHWNVRNIYAAGSYLQIEAICNECVDFLAENLSPENVIDWTVFANNVQYFSNHKLLRRCIKFIKAHAFSSPRLRANLHHLPLGILKQILESDELWVPNEYDRFILAKETLTNKIKMHKAKAEVSMDVEHPSQTSTTVDRKSERSAQHTGDCNGCTPVSSTMDEKEEGSSDMGCNEVEPEPIGLAPLTSHPLSASCDVECALEDILVRGVHYAHVHEERILDLRAQITDLNMADVLTAFEKGMWERHLLRLMIKGVEPPQDNPPSRALCPRAHSSIGSEDAPPIYRFGTRIKRVREMKPGEAKCSKKHFYAGSNWWVHCHKRDDKGKEYYGLFLCREKPSLSTTDTPRYTDQRKTLDIWQKLTCLDMSFACEKKNYPLQGWGWPKFIRAEFIDKYVDASGALMVVVCINVQFGTEPIKE